MSYVNKLEYRIVPANPFHIVRGCAGCGCKQSFICKGNFRINANGNNLDIWLIYGCRKCGHTYNLPIYERIKAEKISRTEYPQFLANDEETVIKYGTDKSLFARNRAEIDWNAVEYEVIAVEKNEIDLENGPIEIILDNPCDLPVRKDKLLADALEISRSKVNQLLKSGFLTVETKR